MTRNILAIAVAMSVGTVFAQGEAENTPNPVPRNARIDPDLNPTAGLSIQMPTFQQLRPVRTTGLDSSGNAAANGSALPSTVTLPSCGPEPYETETDPCPPGQSGQIIRRKVYASRPRPMCWEWTSPWWIVESNTCSGGQPPPGSCPQDPPVEERNVACPVPQTGTIRQRREYILNPYPTCWTATGNWINVSNNCTNPNGPTCGDPPDSLPTRNVPCPAGFEGTITEEGTWNPVPYPECWRSQIPAFRLQAPVVRRTHPDSCRRTPRWRAAKSPVVARIMSGLVKRQHGRGSRVHIRPVGSRCKL
jgi:hypothetical protein